MRRISIAASLLLLSSSVALADSATIKEAFANGKASGDITVYTESKDNTGTTKDSGFTAGSIGVSYSTDTFNGFSGTATFRANTELTEKEIGDYSGTMAEDAILAEAYIKYEDENAALIIGRQEIDLEWLGDYNEAVVGVLKMIPDTTVVLGYTNRNAVVGYDEVVDWADIGNGIAGKKQKGAYVLDVKYTGVEGLEVNPYAYSAPELADFYGLKVSYDTDMYGVTAQYATSSEDTNITGTKDGDIAHLEARLNVMDIALAAGYIKTDKDGIGSIAALGDNLSPMDDGENIYGEDAKTYYASIGYEIAGIGLTALYSNTDYQTNLDTDELNLIVDYSFTDELSANLTYVDSDSTGTANDYDKVFANLTYAF